MPALNTQGLVMQQAGKEGWKYEHIFMNASVWNDNFPFCR